MSVYRAKGRAFVGALQSAKQAPGGRDAVAAKMGPLGARLEEFYVENGWYDVEVLAALMSATAELMGTSASRHIQAQAHGAAKTDIVGIYRHTLRAETPSAMAKRLPRAFNRYFQPSAARLISAEPTRFSAALEQIPVRQESFFIAMNEGFVTGALEAVRAIDPRVRIVERRVEGLEVALTFVASWSGG